jgi:hypothetical protein
VVHLYLLARVALLASLEQPRRGRGVLKCLVVDAVGAAGDEALQQQQLLDTAALTCCLRSGCRLQCREAGAPSWRAWSMSPRGFCQWFRLQVGRAGLVVGSQGLAGARQLPAVCSTAQGHTYCAPLPGISRCLVSRRVLREARK